jgi:hypothetical protein
MARTNKYDLDFRKTINYFIDHVKCGNFLSEMLIKKINFHNGSFFTLLPDNANLENIYDFPFGGILKGSERVYNTPFSNAWSVPNIDIELSEFIHKYLLKNLMNFAVFEHVIAKPEDPRLKINDITIAIFKDQVYYVAFKKTSTDLIEKIVRKTGRVWHFLAVLTQGNIPSKLTEKDFDTICENLSYVIAGAYDGEGYIIWEKNGIKEPTA